MTQRGHAIYPYFPVYPKSCYRHPFGGDKSIEGPGYEAAKMGRDECMGHLVCISSVIRSGRAAATAALLCALQPTFEGDG